MANTKVTGDLIASGTITAANLVTGTLDGLLNTYLTTNAYATQSYVGTYLTDNNYATEGYVTTAVANLVDTAPASLDTLNELAAALNDDANFATTVTNALSTKLNLSGGNITGNLSVDTNVLFVDTVNDRVGIGTSSPTHNLHISNTGGSAYQRLTADFGDAYIGMETADDSFRIVTAQATNIQLYTINTERMRITSAGNVGIGTSSPVSKLTIIDSGANFSLAVRQESTFSFGSLNGKRVALITNDSGDFNGLQLGYDAVDGTGVIAGATNNLGAGIDFYTYNGSSWGNRMRITSAGKVGINQTPTAQLDVNSGATNTVAAFRSTDSGAFVGFADPSTTLDAGYPTLSIGAVGNDLTLNTSNSEKVRITSSGNVGIGTNSPLFKLHVVGDIASFNSDGKGVYSYSTDANLDSLLYSGWTGGTGMEIRYHPNTAVGYIDNGYQITPGQAFGDIHFRQNSAGTKVSRMMIKADGGNVGIGTTAPGAKLTVQGDIQTQTFKTFFYAEAGGQTRSILTVATDNTSGVAYLEIIYNRNNSNLRGARKFSALTHWYGSTKGAVQVNADISVDININPPTVSWSGNVLQITIDTTANGGALIVNASAHYRSGTPFTWS